MSTLSIKKDILKHKANQDGQLVILGTPTDQEIENQKQQAENLKTLNQLNALKKDIDDVLKRLTDTTESNQKNLILRAESIKAFLNSLEFLKNTSHDNGEIKYTSKKKKNCTHTKINATSILKVQNQNENFSSYEKRIQDFLNNKYK